MPTTKVKICGMKHPDNIRAVAGVTPDFMGFIFYEPSPRFVGHSFQMPTFSGDIKKVGVFVSESIQRVLQIKDQYQLDYVQLHGNEAAVYCKNLHERCVKIIKAFAIHDAFDFGVLKDYEAFVDFFLFDTAGKLPGGNGQVFDWQLLDQYTGRIPFLLSGGLNIENVFQLKHVKHPLLYGVDLNSGVENSPGEKSLYKIEELLTKLN